MKVRFPSRWTRREAQENFLAKSVASNSKLVSIVRWIGSRQRSGINLKVFLDLSAAVDVYSDWIDACDAVAKDAAVPEHAGPSYTEDDGAGYAAENDDAIIDDEYDGEADFEI